MSCGNLHPYSVLYIGPTRLLEVLSRRREECLRQLDYWTHEYGAHGDETAMRGLRYADEMLGRTETQLSLLRDHPDAYRDRSYP